MQMLRQENYVRAWGILGPVRVTAIFAFFKDTYQYDDDDDDGDDDEK